MHASATPRRAVAARRPPGPLPPIPLELGWRTASVRRGRGAVAVILACLLAVLLSAAPAGAQSFWDELLSGFEVAIGRSVADNVVREYGPPARLPATRQQWVQGIFADIVAQARRKDISYQLTVLDSQVVNAFAAPGGYIFITTALLEHVGKDADALANVLGHEVAHVEHKHGMNTLGRQLGIGLVLDLLFGGQQQRDNALFTAAQVATQLISLGWSREQEHEADDRGQRLAAAAGYDPMGMVRFFEVLQRLQGQEVPFLEFLSTHPLTSERIERARARAAELRGSSPAR